MTNISLSDLLTSLTT